MKVLLISPNIETLPDPVFPLGTAAIAGVLKAKRISCRVLDLCFVDDYPAAIAQTLSRRIHTLDPWYGQTDPIGCSGYNTFIKKRLEGLIHPFILGL